MNRITKFYSSNVSSLLPYSSCVIDFYASDPVMIIEINPFHNGAGACNFSWAKDRDLFMNGPQEWRFTEKEEAEGNLSSLLTVQWERIILAELDKRRNHLQHPKTQEQGKPEKEKAKKKGIFFFWH